MNSPVSGAPARNYSFPPGLVGLIATFLYQAAPRPVMEIALAGALGLMSGIAGRSYNISATGLNQYILLLAPTGTGKEAIHTGIARLLSTIKYAVPASQGFVGPSHIASEQALIKHLSKHSKCFVSIVGEFGLMLQQLCAPNADSVQVGLKKIYLDLYHKSGKGSVLYPLIYNDREKNTEPVSAPAFSLLGESTPESFYSALDESMISQGLLPRFTIIEYSGPRVALNESHSQCTPSIELVNALTRLCVSSLGLMHSERVIDVTYDPGADAQLKSFEIYSTKQVNEASNELTRQLWNRAHMKALKLSALVAVGIDPIEPIIHLNVAEWATNFAFADIQSLVARFERGDIGNDNLEAKQAESMLSAVSKRQALYFLHR